MDRRQRALEAREQARARISSASQVVFSRITIPSAEATKELAKAGEAFAGHIRDFISPRTSR